MILPRKLSWMFLCFFTLIFVIPSHSRAPKKIEIKFDPMANASGIPDSGYLLHYDIIGAKAPCTISADRPPAHQIDLGERTRWVQDETMRPGYRYIFAISSYRFEKRISSVDGSTTEARWFSLPSNVLCIIIPGGERPESPELDSSGFDEDEFSNFENNFGGSGSQEVESGNVVVKMSSPLPPPAAALLKHNQQNKRKNNSDTVVNFTQGSVIPASAAGTIQSSSKKTHSWNPLINAANADTNFAANEDRGTNDIFETSVVKNVSKITRVFLLILALVLVILFKDSFKTWAKLNLEKAVKLKFRRSK